MMDNYKIVEFVVIIVCGFMNTAVMWRGQILFKFTGKLPHSVLSQTLYLFRNKPRKKENPLVELTFDVQLNHTGT
jgi:hypothetical protein